MSFQSTDELGRVLVRLQLVTPAQLDECLADLRSAANDPSALLRALEARHDLTSYQVAKLEKRQTDGLVLGKYKLLYRNAAGSFARVFRACSVDDGQMVGVKLLRQRWAKDRNTVAQFQREALVCKKLKHKNIVPIYEVGSDGDLHYFTMEFVEGGNLRDFLKIRGKLSPLEATRCVLDMAEGLEYAFRQGITHRDLKLTNVLMSAHGVAKLVDFGLAGNDGSGGAAGDGVQRALEYTTLERGSGAPLDDPRSDLYFLGAIYYELVSGTPPYPPTSSREERKSVSRYRNIRPLKGVDPSLPRVLTDMVDRMMAFSPSQRYQTPSEVVGDLRRVLRELGDDGNGGAETPSGGSDLRTAAAADNSLPAIMFVENRVKHQDVLRDYFSKRGYRVLVLSDAARALTRLKNNPPDAVIFMGEAIGDGIVATFTEASRLARPKTTILVAVLSEKQADLRGKLSDTKTCRVMQQPITLRDLRGELQQALERRLSDVV